MLIKCPSCGSQNSLDSLIDDEPAAQALMLALKLTPVGRSLVKYLGLFRPEKKQLSWAKVAKLLGELTPLIEAQRIERNGVAHIVPMAVWESSITKVLEARDAGRLTTPIKTHGYLFEVIVTEVQRSQADKETRVQAKKDDEKRIAEQRLADARKLADEKHQPPKQHTPAPVPKEWADTLKGMLMDAKKPVERTPEQQVAHEQALAKLKEDARKQREQMPPEQRAAYEKQRQDRARLDQELQLSH